MKQEDIVLLAVIALLVYWLSKRAPVGTVTTESKWFNPDTQTWEPLPEVSAPWLPSRRMTRAECEAALPPGTQWFRDPCEGF